MASRLRRTGVLDNGPIHTSKASLLTAAAQAGAPIRKMQGQSRHKSLNVLSGYVRSARLFDDHAGKDFA